MPSQKNVFARTIVLRVVVTAVSMVVEPDRAAEVAGGRRCCSTPFSIDRLGMRVGVVMNRPAMLMHMHMGMSGPGLGSAGSARHPKDHHK